MTTTRVRVLIADDHAVVRTGLRALLDPDPAVEVIADVAGAGDAVERSRIGDVDVVLMDLRFAGAATRAGTSARTHEPPHLKGARTMTPTLTHHELSLIHISEPTRPY